MSFQVGWLVSLITLWTSVLAQAEPVGRWALKFWQDTYVVARLTPVAPAVGSLRCREGFQNARVEAQANLGELGQVAAAKKAPQLFKSREIENAKVRKNLRIELNLEFEGCSFGSHFVPHSGHIDLFGDFGPAQIGPSRFVYAPSKKNDTMNATYLAQLSGNIRKRGYWGRKDMVPPISAPDIRQIGTLQLSIDKGPYANLNGEFSDDIVKLYLDLWVVLEVAEEK